MVKYNVQNLLGSHQVSAIISVRHDHFQILMATRLLTIIKYYSSFIEGIQFGKEVSRVVYNA